ncbi:MAG: TRAP transporter substrate-binding protein [Marinifilaceae bacterium]
MSHNLNQRHPVHKGLLHLDEKLQKISNGKMRVDIYSGGQLGSENQCLEMLQLGSLALTKVSAASLSNFVEEYKVFGLPYMFENKQQLFALLDGDVGRDLLELTQPYMFKGLGYFDAGARSFYSVKKPILTPADLKGLKIRVMQSNMAIDMMKAFGGSATPISAGELYTALQSGVVDGAENNPPTYETTRDYEVAPHFAINEHTMLPEILIISNVVWNNLSSQEQSWLMTAVKSAEQYQRKVWAEQETESMELVQKAGVKIYYPDKKPFMELVRDMPERYKNNERLYGMVQRIRLFTENYATKTTNNEDSNT